MFKIIDSIKAIIKHYDSLTPTIPKIEFIPSPDGTKMVEQANLLRASEYFNIKDANSKLDDVKTETLIEESRMELMRLLLIKTRAILEYRFYQGKFKEEDYSVLKREGTNLNTHEEIYEWCIRVLILLDVISDAKIIDYQLIMNYKGEIETIKKRPEGVISYEHEEKQNLEAEF